MERATLTLGLIADCQYADADSAYVVDDRTGAVIIDRRYRDSLGCLREAISVFEDEQVDAIINLGDLVDRGIGDLPPVADILRTAHAPVWNVAGNHDFGDRAVARSEVFAALDMPAPFYDRTIGGVVLLFLDTNEVGVIEYPDGSPEHRQGASVLESARAAGRVNAHDWNGGVGTAQLDWLRSRLRRARELGQRAVLVSHHPFFPDSSHNVLNDTELRRLVLDFPEVILALSGHNHAGGYGVLGTAHCLTLHGMVERSGNAFAIARVFADRIEIDGFGRQPTAELRLSDRPRPSPSTPMST